MLTESQAASINESAEIVHGALSRVVRTDVYLTNRHRLTLDPRGTLVGCYRLPVPLADLIADARHVATEELDCRMKPASTYRRARLAA